MTRLLVTLLAQLLGWSAPELHAAAGASALLSVSTIEKEASDEERRATGAARTEALFILKNRRNSLHELGDIARSELNRIQNVRFDMPRRSLLDNRPEESVASDGFTRGIYPEYLRQIELFQDALEETIASLESEKHVLTDKAVQDHVRYADTIREIAQLQEKVVRCNQRVISQQKKLGVWQRKLRQQRGKTRSYLTRGRSKMATFSSSDMKLKAYRVNCGKCKFTLNKARQQCKIVNDALRQVYAGLPESFKTDGAIRRALKFFDHLDAARMRLIS